MAATYHLYTLIFNCDKCDGFLYDPKTFASDITPEMVIANDGYLPCDSCGTKVRIPRVKGFNA